MLKNILISNCKTCRFTHYINLRTISFSRNVSSTTNTQQQPQNQTENLPNSRSNVIEDMTKKLFRFMSLYEEIIGIKEVKLAQQSVLDAEKNFIEVQNYRRQLNSKLIESQQKLRSLRDEMDRLNRTDAQYLKLFTEEHGLLNNESKLVNDYKLKEEEERDLFFRLSSSLRDAQEKERVRVERMKYLQFSLSILCAVLGILSTYLLNYFRNSNIREILDYDKEQFPVVKELVTDVISEQAALRKYLEENFSKINQTKSTDDDATPIIPIENPQPMNLYEPKSIRYFFVGLALAIVCSTVYFNK